MQTTKPVTKPTKQRKMLYQAPHHIRHKLLAAHLSPELRTSHGTKNLPVRSGDTVRVMRGDHKGFEGKVSRVDHKKYRIYIEGLTREKVDGTAIFAPIHPSKVMVTRLNLDDKWRKKILERKKGLLKKTEKKAEKAEKPEIEPKKEPAEVVETKETAPKKMAPEEKTRKKKAQKGRKRVTKRKTVEKAKPETEEIKKKDKARAGKKQTRRKTASKTEKEETEVG